MIPFPAPGQRTPTHRNPDALASAPTAPPAACAASPAASPPAPKPSTMKSGVLVRRCSASSRRPRTPSGVRRSSAEVRRDWARLGEVGRDCSGARRRTIRISAASPLHLGCISAASRLHLGCISAASRHAPATRSRRTTSRSTARLRLCAYRATPRPCLRRISAVSRLSRGCVSALPPLNLAATSRPPRSYLGCISRLVLPRGALQVVLTRPRRRGKEEASAAALQPPKGRLHRNARVAPQPPQPRRAQHGRRREGMVGVALLGGPPPGGRVDASSHPLLSCRCSRGAAEVRPRCS